MPKGMALSEAVAGFVRQQAADQPETQLATTASSAAWLPFAGAGTRLWLDTGDIDEATRLWCRQFAALTTNNTLLNREVQKGQYDTLIQAAAACLDETAPELSESERVREIAFVLNARHGLRLVQRFGAKVSVELHTDCANDVDLTLAYAQRFHAICPDAFYVKIPFTPAGLIAARKLGQNGITVNMTLGFSARQNHLIARFANAAYVNVFIGRLNAFVADNELGDGVNVGEKATLATQRELVRLRRIGAATSRLIGASMRNAEQVASLAGVDVFTMPTKVAAAFAEKPVTPTRQVDQDPVVTTAAGVTLADFAGESLWAVPDSLAQAVETLLKTAYRMIDPAALQHHLASAGFADLLPVWSTADIARTAADGKIPVYANWASALRDGRVGLDALMNLSALQSFTQDQAALDGRIRSLI